MKNDRFSIEDVKVHGKDNKKRGDNRNHARQIAPSRSHLKDWSAYGEVGDLIGVIIGITILKAGK
jgi:hypothetical protein